MTSYVFLFLAGVQLYIGYFGIERRLGPWWAIGAVAIAFFTHAQVLLILPLVIGGYFAEVDVFGWPWWAGVLLTLPGCLFVAYRSF